MNCRLCQSENTSVIKNVLSPHTRSEYHLFYCRNCRSRFFDPGQYDIDFRDFYRKLSRQHETTINPQFKEKKIWIDLKDSLIHLLGKKPAGILDVGCRTGDFLLHFEDDILREGVELADEYVDIARQRGLHIYNDFLENIHVDKKYDIVSCLAILEHLTEPVKFLNAVNNLVNDQGLLVILVPGFECLKEKILGLTGIRWHMYSPPEHLNFYSRHFLDHFMKQKGFTLVRREFTSGGLINPVQSIAIIRKIIGKLFYMYDRSWLNRIPVFDHMYSIYKKEL